MGGFNKMMLRRRILLQAALSQNQSNALTYYGDIVTFQSTIGYRCASLRAYFDYNPSGYTGLEITYCEKNLLDIDIESIKSINSTGTWGGYHDYTYTDNDFTTRLIVTEPNNNLLWFELDNASDDTYTFDIPVTNTLAGKRVVLYGGASSSNQDWEVRLQEVAPQNIVLGSINSTGTSTISIPKDATDLRIRFAINGKATEQMYLPMILSPQAADTGYAGYYGQTYYVDWSDIGVLYGGSVDLITGELVSLYTSNGSQMYNPIIYQLPIQESISTKSGINNIWCNSGDVEVVLQEETGPIVT